MLAFTFDFADAEADVASLVYLATLSGFGKIFNTYLFIPDAIHQRFRSYLWELHAKLV